MKQLEKILPRLMDMQRFVGNKRIAAMLRDAEMDCGEALSEDELSYVNAAGDANARRRPEENR